MPVVVVTLACVAALVAPLAGWWVARAGDSESFGGVCVFVAGIVVGLLSLRRAPSPAWTAFLSLMVGATALVLGVVVDVRIVQMTGVLCLVHATIGVVAPTRVHALVPALWLCILGLPLAGDLDVVGFPARVFAAKVAQSALSMFGAHVVGAETVLVVEGNVADVEAPCAGLSTLRLLAAVVLVVGALRRTGHLRIVAALVAAGVVAVVGNALRVTVLAALALVAERADLAALVHVPLGVLAFVGAIVVADLLLRGPQAPPSPRPISRWWPKVAVGSLVVVTATTTLLRTQTPPRPTLSLKPSSSSSPSASSIPLTQAEQGLFGRHALSAEKRALDAAHDGADGSVLVVIATSLRAHHAPERCLAGSGLRVDASTETVIAGVPVKKLVLDGGARIGVSFYVRADADTADHAVVFGSLVDRAVDQLSHRGPWAFVSAVVEARSPDAPDREPDLDVLVPRLLDDARHRLRPTMELP